MKKIVLNIEARMCRVQELLVSCFLAKLISKQACHSTFVEHDDRHRRKVRKGIISFAETNLLCKISRRSYPWVKARNMLRTLDTALIEGRKTCVLLTSLRSSWAMLSPWLTSDDVKIDAVLLWRIQNVSWCPSIGYSIYPVYLQYT